LSNLVEYYLNGIKASFRRPYSTTIDLREERKQRKYSVWKTLRKCAYVLKTFLLPCSIN